MFVNLARRSSDTPPVTLEGATFDGMLRIDEPETARQALLGGIGSAKAYGFGLRTLAPPHPPNSELTCGGSPTPKTCTESVTGHPASTPNAATSTAPTTPSSWSTKKAPGHDPVDPRQRRFRGGTHRSGIAWSTSAVRVILTNPRYTGRRVRNKQRTDEVLLDVDDVAMGHTGIMHWNARDKWVVSKEITHEPPIDDATFEQAQANLQKRGRGTGGQHVKQRTRNPYGFRGLIYCAACDRRMQGQYNHGNAYYRCRLPQEYALANQADHPHNVYLREDALTDPLDTRLASAFTPHRTEQTITAMADAQPLDHPPSYAKAAPAIITECDAKPERYRAALDAGTDPAVVTEWNTQTRPNAPAPKPTSTRRRATAHAA
ncbi:type I-E CRISPR-associated protein Cas6/Cse3/CasE [Micromonospora sp. LOL_025]|uniref:type I-E CRISPR-associated protein Cas6/Cse3/CasE n=1 Tax=Micromonospora sp. LOL_025 TaxID=3345413 RepID=UPI003A8A73A2